MDICATVNTMMLNPQLSVGCYFRWRSYEVEPWNGSGPTMVVTMPMAVSGITRILFDRWLQVATAGQIIITYDP